MGKSNTTIVRASAVTTGSYVVSTVYPCASHDWVEIEIDGIAGAASDVVMVILEVTKDDLNTPAASKKWRPLTATDHTVTSQSVGTVPAGAGYGDFGFGVPGYFNVVLTTTAAAALNDKIYRSAVLYVGSAKAIRAQVRGSAGTPTAAVSMSSFGPAR